MYAAIFDQEEFRISVNLDRDLRWSKDTITTLNFKRLMHNKYLYLTRKESGLAKVRKRSQIEASDIQQIYYILN